jgi:hypothetical protein
MPKLPRGAGPIGLAMGALDVWRKLPKHQREAILKQVRTNGPRVAKGAAKAARAASRRLS